MAKLEISNRKGIIELNETLLFHDKEILKAFFKNFYPYDIFPTPDIFNNRMLKYHCISELFEEVEKGQETPTYLVYFRRTEGGEVLIESLERKNK